MTRVLVGPVSGVLVLSLAGASLGRAQTNVAAAAHRGGQPGVPAMSRSHL